jgi:hypothetical protein
VLVSAWRSSVLLADGVAVGRPGALRTVLACEPPARPQRARRAALLGASSTRARTCTLPAARARAALGAERRVRELAVVAAAAHGHARELLLDACPAYDERAVVRAALASRGRPRHPTHEALRWQLILPDTEPRNDEEWLLRVVVDLDPDGS